jgi:hypothetical protein
MLDADSMRGYSWRVPRSDPEARVRSMMDAAQTSAVEEKS